MCGYKRPNNAPAVAHAARHSKATAHQSSSNCKLCPPCVSAWTSVPEGPCSGGTGPCIVAVVPSSLHGLSYATCHALVSAIASQPTPKGLEGGKGPEVEQQHQRPAKRGLRGGLGLLGHANCTQSFSRAPASTVDRLHPEPRAATHPLSSACCGHINRLLCQQRCVSWRGPLRHRAAGPAERHGNSLHQSYSRLSRVVTRCANP